MRFNNNYIHAGFSFGLIWNLIKGNDTTGSRLLTAFLWLLLLLGMLYVLLLWHSVPTYTHYIYLDRLYSKKPSYEYMLAEHKNDYYVTANYKMCLSSGASAFQNKQTTRFYEEVMFVHELSFPVYESQYKNKRGWSSMFMNSCNPKKYNDVLSPKLSEQASVECAKNKLQFSDFNYCYFFLHRYQDDISRYNNEKDKFLTVNSETDTLNKYYKVSKRFIREYTGKVLDEDLFVQEKDIPHIPTIPFKGETKYVALINDGISVYGGGKGSKNQNAFSNFFYSLFQMYDLTKAKYNIYLNSNAIDSINYTIVFEEGVSFSDINVNPDAKDMYTLVFRVADRKKEIALSKGIKFYVEFLESSNIQYIRALFLGGVCCVPLLKIFGKIRSIITEPTPKEPNPTVPESKPVAIRNRIQQRNRSKKKK